jgi:hypothetical protein
LSDPTLSTPRDASAADWVVSSGRDFDYTVGSVVPAGFEAYARVFHPAAPRHGDSGVDMRWSEVASANDREMHPAAEWGSLTGSWQLERQDGLWDNEPCTGELPQRVASPLADVLARFTTTAAQCWFAPTAMRDRFWMLFVSDTASAQEKLAA